MANNTRDPGDDDRTLLTLVIYDSSKAGATEVPLRFVELDGRPFVFGRGGAKPAWVGVIARNPHVRWTIGGAKISGRAEIVTDSSRRTMVERKAKATFGVQRFESWFGPKTVCVGLEEYRGPTSGYYSQVESFFDTVSETYDEVVQGNPEDAYLRTISVRVLLETFHEGDRVLELGCGTGLETIALAEAGRRIVATDISAGMLHKLAAKASSLGVAERVATRRTEASNLAPILEEFGPHSFDGAFSDFGALNTEPALEAVAASLAQLIRPNGSLVVTVWNRVCVTELLLYTLRLRPGRALARTKSPVPVGESRFGVPVFPQTPGGLVKLLSPDFVKVALMGVPTFVPPYDLARRVPAMNALLPLLASLDDAFSTRYPLNYLGDHFLLRLRRRSDLSGADR